MRRGGPLRASCQKGLLAAESLGGREGREEEEEEEEEGQAAALHPER